MNHTASLKVTRSRRRRQAKLRRLRLSLCFCLFMITAWICLSGFRKVTVHQSGAYKYYNAVMVNSGETLWDLAGDYETAGYENIWSYIQDIKDINDLDGNRLIYGETIVIPYYSNELK